MNNLPPRVRTTKQLPITSAGTILRDNSQRSGKRHNPPRPPLRLLRELEEEFGMSTHSLAQVLTYSAVKPPEPRVRTAAGVWYEPEGMRRWWKAHRETLTASRESDIIAI